MKLIRLLLISSALVYAFSPAYAQTAQNNNANVIANALHLHMMPAPQPAHYAGKTTIMQSRLIAEAESVDTGTAFLEADSILYTYTGTRTGNINLVNGTSNLNFDTSIYYYINSNDALALYSREIQLFDVNNNVLKDSTWQWDATNNVYVSSNSNNYTYDANNNRLTAEQVSWNTLTSQWVLGYMHVYTYDGNSNMLTDLDQSWNSTNSAWDNYSEYIYTYTTANKMSSELYQSWSGNQWDTSYQILFAYDGNNNLTTETQQDYNAGVWTNDEQATYTYDGSNDMTTYTDQLWTNNAWVYSGMETFSNFVAQNPQTIISQSWNGTAWSNTQRALITYNSYNQETTVNTQSWTGSDWQPQAQDISVNLYYELYSLNVNAVSNNGGNAKIYPVPAQNELNISLTWDEPQAAVISIYDVQGRAVKQWQVPAATTYNNTISVNDVAPGTYFINITGANGHMVQKLVITK